LFLDSSWEKVTIDNSSAETTEIDRRSALHTCEAFFGEHEGDYQWSRQPKIEKSRQLHFPICTILFGAKLELCMIAKHSDIHSLSCII
jgi:hypothetical protein